MKNYCLTLSYDDVSMELMKCYEIDEQARDKITGKAPGQVSVFS